MVNLDPEADLVRAPSANASVRRKGRPRSQKVHQAILQAALELVQEVGFSDLTIEGIATQAGTSQLTIYRRWPTKAAIVMEGLAQALSISGLSGVLGAPWLNSKYRAKFYAK
jgi:AcrR family transcriptional regulator